MTTHLRLPDPADVESSRRRLVLGLALLTALVEIAVLAEVIPGIEIGDIAVSASLLPGLALAVACGSRLLGRSAHRWAAIAYWGAIAISLPVLAVSYAADDDLGIWTGLLAAALDEELVYRLAIPLVVAALLQAARVAIAPARIAGLVVSGAWFILLPGHREQVAGAGDVVVFVAFTILASLIVYRSGSILPLAAGHATINLWTYLLWSDSVNQSTRSWALASLLGLLLLAYGRPRRLAHEGPGLVDTWTGQAVALIDLRDGTAPTATLADGSEVELGADYEPPADLEDLAVDQPSSERKFSQ